MMRHIYTLSSLNLNAHLYKSCADSTAGRNIHFQTLATRTFKLFCKVETNSFHSLCRKLQHATSYKIVETRFRKLNSHNNLSLFALLSKVLVSLFRIMSWLDADGDGEISSAELAALDIDGDGKISKVL